MSSRSSPQRGPRTVQRIREKRASPGRASEAAASAQEIGMNHRSKSAPIRHVIFTLLLLAASATSLLAQTQTQVTYKDDFQSYGTQKNPPGWVDTSVGSSKPIANGLYKTWPDPLQGNQGANVVYGTKQSSGKPDGNNPRIGTFSTLTSNTFVGKGRFEYSGRFIVTNTDTRIAFTFFSSYPENEQYYLISLSQQAAPSTALTMQLFGVGAGSPTVTTDSQFTPSGNKWHRFAI